MSGRPEALGLGASGRPPDGGEHSCNPLLIARADFAHVDAEGGGGYIHEGNAIKSRDESPDRLFPYVGLVSGGPLRLDVLALKVDFGPPMLAGSEGGDGLDKQLVAIAGEHVE